MTMSANPLVIGSLAPKSLRMQGMPKTRPGLAAGVGSNLYPWNLMLLPMVGSGACSSSV